MSKGISVVIPNYNGMKLLPQILPPLFAALDKSRLSHEVIISDDCSTDESVSYLRKHFPLIIIITSEINHGFSPTINKGIFAAQYDHLLLLNSDVKLEPDYFIPLLRYFEQKDTFGVMGRIIGWDDDAIQDAAKFPSFHGAKIKTTGNYLPDQILKDDWIYSMYLSGANAFVDRRKILQLKGFDEIFAPFYVEDFELSLRAWRLGWKCYYEHNAVCRHKTSTSIRSKSSKKFVNTIYYRNKMFLHAIHLTRERLALWYLQLIPETLIRLFTGRFWYLASLKMFIASRSKTTASIKKLDELALKLCVPLLSVEDVVKKITTSLQHKNISRF